MEQMKQAAVLAQKSAEQARAAAERAAKENAAAKAAQIAAETSYASTVGREEALRQQIGRLAAEHRAVLAAAEARLEADAARVAAHLAETRANRMEAERRFGGHTGALVVTAPPAAATAGTTTVVGVEEVTIVDREGASAEGDEAPSVSEVVTL